MSWFLWSSSTSSKHTPLLKPRTFFIIITTGHFTPVVIYCKSSNSNSSQANPWNSIGVNSSRTVRSYYPLAITRVTTTVNNSNNTSSSKFGDCKTRVKPAVLTSNRIHSSNSSIWMLTSAWWRACLRRRRHPLHPSHRRAWSQLTSPRLSLMVSVNIRDLFRIVASKREFKRRCKFPLFL